MLGSWSFTMSVGFYTYGGIQRSPIMNEAQRRVYDRLMPEPEPSFEERRQRCADLGLIVCSCRGVETEQGHKLIYDVNCPVHHGERRRC